MTMKKTSNPLARRAWLQKMCAVTAAAWLPLPATIAVAQPAPALSSISRGRLVVVFLRGAYDGLSAIIPYADEHYARLRQSTYIAAPDPSNPSAALRLDAQFALHPALAALYPLWQSGVLSFVHASGSPDPTRSHFEAQHHWEVGIPGKNSAAPGWLNRLAALAPNTTTAAIGVGEANPAILSGPASVRLIPHGQTATRTGVLANDRQRSALMDLYAGSDKLGQAFRSGAESRMQSAEELNKEIKNEMRNEMQQADNGAASVTGLALDAQHLGTLMRQDKNLRLGFLSAGGWDTHANQGNAEGRLAKNFENLAAALLQLRRDFNQPNDVIVVCSEFGRTCAENGTQGTDHGHGNVMLLIGNSINGGQRHGEWRGLAKEQLYEGRDLPVLNDFRAVFGQVLRSVFGLSLAQIQQVFPNLSPQMVQQATLKHLVKT